MLVMLSVLFGLFAISNGQLISTDVINTYCPLWNNVCAYGAAPLFTDMADCQSYMATVDESGLLCRLYHLGLARTDPLTHCPHAAKATVCLITSATLPTDAQFCGASGYATNCTIANGVSFQTTSACESWYNSSSTTNMQKIFAYMSVIQSFNTTSGCAGASMAGLVTQYCSAFNSLCGYGMTANYFGNSTSCMMFFVGMDVPSMLCRYYHLVFAARNSSLQATHCPHAGMSLPAPCPKTVANPSPLPGGAVYCNNAVAIGDSAGGFSNGYCAYGGTGQFATQAACTTAYNAMSDSTKLCVAYHLALSTQGNSFAHCQHASGRAPCGSAAVLAMTTTTVVPSPTSGVARWGVGYVFLFGLLHVVWA